MKFPDPPISESQLTSAVMRRFAPWMNRDLFCLFVSRALRSFAQGYMAVIVPLYIAILGYGAVQLGILASATAIVSALVAGGVGILSDRFGRKNFIFLISLMMAGSGVVFCLSRSFATIVFAAALGTYGGGGGAGRGGAWGPFYPAAQALLAEHSSDLDRTTVFGALSFVGVLASALGSLAASVPQLLHRTTSLTLLQGYDALFLLTALVGVLMAAAVVPVRETNRRHPQRRKSHALQSPAGDSAKDGRRLGLSRRSWRIVARFMVTNATNGLAVGMFAPFIVYWFYRRFGVDAAQLGSLLFSINLVAAIPFLTAGRLALRLGAVSTVVITRAISCVLLGAMAVMPAFWLAAMLYALRTIFNTLSLPVRQSYLMGIIHPEERASAAGISNFPSQVAMAIVPSFAGYLMENIWLGLPLEAAAILQAINSILYHTLFRNIRPVEELGGENE